MSLLDRPVLRASAGAVSLVAVGALVLTAPATAADVTAATTSTVTAPHAATVRTATTPTTPATAARATSSVSAPLARGLYQSAYSERNDVLWATAAVGQPPAPVTGARLVKVDPDTLEVVSSYAPPLDATGQIQAAYGIDVDDEHNTVWVTDTRSHSVSVYSQRDGRHLATLPDVPHPREVVVDEARDTVWATAFGDGSLVAFDSRTFEETGRVTVPGAGPTGLAVNERTGAAYAADFTHDRIIEAAPGAAVPRLIPTGDGPLSVALSVDGRTAYTADQGTGTLSVVGLREGAVVATVPTGAGAKSVASHPRSGRVLVVNRLAGSVSVVDPRTRVVVETVTTAALPNHVQVTNDGTAYVLDKSASGPAGEDLITRVRLGASHR
ncbi:YncE family protein [uncultured Streptomyces sp.]|uniref:YncE family protein n=1 Tax=uncultured Streptomyces sp. TaxID=174707 RepID=UPI0026330386|nr:YncE family protein [uncultured Streptomyces sp.]